MNKDYILPYKELLDSDLNENKFYNLSKILLKKDAKEKLTIPLGRSDGNQKYYVDLKSCSGIFIAGETGSGKSMLLDSIIVTLLLKNTPSELNFLLIDSKKIELFEFDGIPHLIDRITNESSKAMESIRKIEDLMKKRKDELAEGGYNSIDDYNDVEENKMPHIVVVVDESTDVIINADPNKVFGKILDEGRPLGIHLILATNAYLPRDFDKEFLNKFSYILSFDLATKDQAKFINLKGADLLTVSGEALVRGNGNIERIQVPSISYEEVDRIVKYLIKNENNES